MTQTPNLDARSIGVLAHRTLRRPGPAVVVARFERSFCLEIDKKLITVGDGDLHDGPLNVRLASTFGGRLSSALDVERNQRWTVSSAGLRRGDGLEIDCTRAAVWQPNGPGAGADRVRLSENLRWLRDLLHERALPEDGLIRLVLEANPPRTATERAAQPYIALLESGLPDDLKGDGADPSAAIQLLGLGPGLTPSGDDLLAGLMIAWHHVGAPVAAKRLGQVLLEAGVGRTHPISLAHLEAASLGYGAAPLHDLLEALVVDDRRALEEALDATAKIGHSSGIDAIAGIMLALNAWIEARRDAPIAA